MLFFPHPNSITVLKILCNENTDLEMCISFSKGTSEDKAQPACYLSGVIPFELYNLGVPFSGMLFIVVLLWI